LKYTVVHGLEVLEMPVFENDTEISVCHFQYSAESFICHITLVMHSQLQKT